MKKILLIAAVSSLILTACAKPENKPAQESTEASAVQTAPAAETAASETAGNATAASADSAETSLDWAGEYKGVFPCADCEGIKTELELKSDKSYELKEKYLGKGDGHEIKSKGTFSFDAENPSVITLDKAAENRKFFIGENYAEARDAETGKAIETKLNYKLIKDTH